MSNQNKFEANELFSDLVSSGGANTKDWIASMQGMVLMCADDNFLPMQFEKSRQADDVTSAPITLR
jgi:hypothetical protein